MAKPTPKKQVAKYANPYDGDDSLSINDQAYLSNESLIARIDTSQSDDLSDLVARFKHCLDCMAFPQLYYKYDVEKFLAGKYPYLHSIDTAKKLIFEMRHDLDILVSPAEGMEQAKAELVKKYLSKGVDS